MQTETTSPQVLSPRRQVRTGRIGLEFDAAATACVQTRCSESGWRAAISRTLRNSGVNLPSVQTADLAGMTIAPADLTLLAAGMKGSEATCVLPMELCELRVLHVPAAEPDELRLMVRGELEAAGMDEPVFDFWTIPAEFSTHRHLISVNVIVADRKAVQSAASVLRKSGIDLISIDSVPTAAARSVALMNDAAISESRSDHASLADLTSLSLTNHATTAGRPVMVVHVGWQRCTCTLVLNSAPLLTRVPVIGGLQSLVEPLAEQLQISCPQVLTMLRGLSGDLPVRPTGRVVRCLVEKIRTWSGPLAEELLRSAAYANRPGLQMFPSDVLIVGSGCLVPGLAEILTQQLNIHTSLWSMRGVDGEEIGGEAALAFAVSVPETGQ